MRSGSSNPTRASHRETASGEASGHTFGCSVSTSRICSPTRITGFKLVAGSWKISEIPAPRTAFISRSVRVNKSRPPHKTLPSCTETPSGKRRINESAVKDFPHPDSPTRAYVSLGRTTKETSRTSGVLAEESESVSVKWLTSSTVSLLFCSRIEDLPHARGKQISA